MCVCVRERERVCVCVCVRERERERECMCVCVCGGGWVGGCVRACLPACLPTCLHASCVCEYVSLCTKCVVLGKRGFAVIWDCDYIVPHPSRAADLL